MLSLCPHFPNENFPISLLIINDYQWRDTFLFLSILVFNIEFKYDKNFLGDSYIHIHVPMLTYI